MGHLDILLERLRSYEETELLELLDLTSYDLVARFRDRIVERADYLFPEIELLAEDMEESLDDLYYEEAMDGFQIEGFEDEE